MDIFFHTRKLQKQCSQDSNMRKTWGENRSKKLRRRLDDLKAAGNLEVMRMLPGRCHELHGDRKGTLSLDLDGQFRLLFKPADEPVPILEDGGLDWKKIRSICILEVGEDTHE